MARSTAPATRASTRTTRSTSQASLTAGRTTRAATKAAPPRPDSAQSTISRKAPANRGHTIDMKDSGTKRAGPAAKLPSTQATKVIIQSVDNDREPIKAFLRIRAHLHEDEPTAAPYLEHLSDTSVRMTEPCQDVGSNFAPPRPRFRPSAAPTTSVYTFSRIFPATTQQPEFFTKTTLPLVRGLLDGENGLLFAYGVTNSGKTFTMEGGSKAGSAGVLPRTLDVIFNSIDGLHSNSRHRPVRLQGIELDDASSGTRTRASSLDNLSLSTEEPVLAEVLAEHLDSSSTLDTDIDPTVLSVDRNYEYSIWLSYAEVYNEKIYDLLADVSESNAPPSSSRPLLLTRKALPIKPSPADDCPDAPSGQPTGKYISGMKQIRVESAHEAKQLVKLGQLHRCVFGTLANSQSSRSHGIVTIKIMKKHRGEKDEASSYTTARLTLIDLAGSERTKHTQTTGERLREAGNINKSLMVLGQCMEVMRANQRRVAQSLAGPKNERTDTREIKKALAVVPFRHSKLTEILMDYFVGDGRAVMIVNVNPYDTGFDENSHVMRFAALAREVHTPAPMQRVPPTPGRLGLGIPQRSGVRTSELVPHRRKVTISTGGHGGRKFSKAEVEILEEDEEESGDEYEDEPLNPLVEALFDELEHLRMQLLESEMRCAIVEAETRDEVIREMEERMAHMEKMFARRLMNEVQQNEMKMDAKIDMLHQSGLIGKTPGKARAVLQDIRGKKGDATSKLHDDEVSEQGTDSDREESSDESSTRSVSPSPLTGKGKKNARPKASLAASEILIPVPPGPEHSFLPSESSGDEAAGTATETESVAGESAEDDDLDEEDLDDNDDDDSYMDDGDTEGDEETQPTRASDDSEWEEPLVPSKIERRSTPSSPLSKAKVSYKSSVISSQPILEADAKPARMKTEKRGSTSVRAVTELTDNLEKLGLSSNAAMSTGGARRSLRASVTQNPAQAIISEDTEEWDQVGPDDSTVIVPVKHLAGQGAKGKKRQLGKKPVMTEEQIERAVDQAEKSGSGKTIRRMARGSK